MLRKSAMGPSALRGIWPGSDGCTVLKVQNTPTCDFSDFAPRCLKTVSFVCRSGEHVSCEKVILLDLLDHFTEHTEQATFAAASIPTHIYSPSRGIVMPSGCQGTREAGSRTFPRDSMQHLGYGLPRRPLLSTSVNGLAHARKRPRWREDYCLCVALVLALNCQDDSWQVGAELVA